MKKLFKLFLLFTLAIMLFSCATAKVEEEIAPAEVVIEKEPVITTETFVVLSTTDMHGRSTARDVASSQEVSNSMLKVASAVKEEVKEFGDSLILIDNGDTIQGNLTAQYAINYRADDVNPMIEAMIYTGYDVWGMGNHEFNFLPGARNKQVEYALENGIDVLAANIVLKSDGENVHGEMVSAGSPYYDPYAIRTLEFESGNSVKVAIIGLSNAANHTWDLETNYPNLQFSSLENPEGLLEFEINKWVNIVKEKENPDLIIITAHSGKGTDDGVTADFLLEAQALTGAKNSSGADLIIYGHDHSENVETVLNSVGKEVDLVNGGGESLTKSVFTLTFTDGVLTDYSVESSLLHLDTYEDDSYLSSIEEKWYEDAYAWASAPLGTFSGGWGEYKEESLGKSNAEMLYSQTKLIDLIHKAQIWSSWQSYESEGIEGATVSIGSAVFAYDRATGAINFVPEDGATISTLELSLLYRYSNNLLCAIEMTGAELYAWMSAVADMFTVEDGSLSFGSNSIYGVDTFYGVDYEFDITKPMGERVTFATINGVDLREIDSIKVALNSYRLSGGYGFYEATGLTEAECFWTASQFLGSDRSPVPTQIGEYVAYMGTVTPNDPVSHGHDSTWRIVY